MPPLGSSRGGFLLFTPGDTMLMFTLLVIFMVCIMLAYAVAQTLMH